MKRLLIIALFFACEGPEGPMGLQGPTGPGERKIRCILFPMKAG